MKKMLVTKSKNLNYSLMEKKTDKEQGEAFTKREGKKENMVAKNLHQSLFSKEAHRP